MSADTAIDPAGETAGGRAAPCRPRVALATQFYPPFIAGAQVQARALAQELSRRIGGCDVITSRYRRDLDRTAREGAVTVRRLRTATTDRWRMPAAFVAAFRYFLITSARYDILHTFCLSPFSLGAMLAAELRGVPTIVRPCNFHREAALARSWIPGGLIWTLFQRADAFVVQRPGLASELVDEGVPREKVVCIPNMLAIGADAAGSDEQTRRAARARLGLPDRPTVLFVGRLVDTKGLDLLRDAWSRLVERHDATLVLVGDGPRSRDLATWAGGLGGSALLTGEQPDPVPYYQAADIFAFPAHQETFGNAVAEAMAHGLAVVSLAAGLVCDFADHDRNALVVDTRSTEAFVEALGRLLADAALRARLGHAARETALRHFAPEAVGAAHLALYHRLMNGADGSRPNAV